MENRGQSPAQTPNMVAKNHLGRPGTRCLPILTLCWTNLVFQLFLQFQGPTTLLLQTRASRLSDVLTTREVNEIANVQDGLLPPRLKISPSASAEEPEISLETPATKADKPANISIAMVGRDGKVRFKETEDFTTLSG